jgi:hypothetical protein
MHFDRTQFAAKTAVRLFFLGILILVFLLSSCTSDVLEELDKAISTQYKWPKTTYSIHEKKGPSFNLDSIRYDSISRYNVYSSIRFDSTVSLTGFGFNYWENGKEAEVVMVRQIVVDTIDLSTIGIYFNKAAITVKPNAEYQLHGFATYVIGEDTTFIPAFPITFKTQSLKKKSK